MKKNYLFGLLAMASMLFTACQEQDVVDASMANTEVVTFAVNMQHHAATRAAELAGRGARADKLYYGVYEKTADGWALIRAISAAQDEGSLQPASIQFGKPTHVEIKLVKQKEYSIIFWATNEDNNVCDVDWAGRTMTMNSDRALANTEANDAFWAYETVRLEGAVAKTVDLYRPFAQLNIGTSIADFNDAGNAQLNVTESKVLIKGVPQTFNMETGRAAGDVDQIYDFSAIPDDQVYKFPVNPDEYRYLAFAYVLVDNDEDEKMLVDVELTCKDADDEMNRTITSVPVQLNYRTNIYGNILTNAADYNVNLKPDLGDGENVLVKEVANVDDFLAAVADQTIDHVVMTGDIDLTQSTTRAEATAQPIFIARDLTIDGKGFKVKTNGTRAFRITKGGINVVFNDVNVVSRAVMQYPNDIRGISIDADISDVSLTLNNCSVDFTDASACDWAYAVNVAGNSARHIININGGKYEGANVVNIHGSEHTVTVKDATLTSLYPFSELYYGSCIWLLQEGNSTLYVSGTTFNGSHAIAINAGSGNNITETNNTHNAVVASPIKYEDKENEYIILSAQALSSYSENKQNGVTLHICADIDFEVAEFKAIPVARSGALTIKGNGCSIKNAKVVSGAEDNTTGQASFFYTYPGSTLTIENLKFENIEVDADINGSGYAGVVVGYAEGAVTLNNVDVNNADVYGEKSCAALVGFAPAGSNLSMTDCDVTNSKVEAKEDRTGAYVGRSIGNTAIVNCSVDNNFVSIAPNGYANKYIGQRYKTCASLTIDGNEYVDTASDLQKIVKNANEVTLMLADGTYSGLLDLTGKTLTIAAFEGANPVFEGLVWADNTTATLKGLTLSNPSGVQHPNPNNSQYYTTINNQYPLVGAYLNANIKLEDCILNIVGPTIYGFYGYAANSPEFVGCTFECNKIRPIANNGPKMKVTGCTFRNPYHYAVRIFENSEMHQTVVFTDNTIEGENDKGEFEGINISKKGGTATVCGDFTIKGNTASLKYRHHANVTMAESCTYETDIEGFAFERED